MAAICASKQAIRFLIANTHCQMLHFAPNLEAKFDPMPAPLTLRSGATASRSDEQQVTYDRAASFQHS